MSKSASTTARVFGGMSLVVWKGKERERLNRGKAVECCTPQTHKSRPLIWHTHGNHKHHGA